MSDTEEENLDEKEGRTLEDPNNELKGGADVEEDEDTVSDQSNLASGNLALFSII